MGRTRESIDVVSATGLRSGYASCAMTPTLDSGDMKPGADTRDRASVSVKSWPGLGVRNAKWCHCARARRRDLAGERAIDEDLMGCTHLRVCSKLALFEGGRIGNPSYGRVRVEAPRRSVKQRMMIPFREAENRAKKPLSLPLSASCLPVDARKEPRVRDGRLCVCVQSSLGMARHVDTKQVRRQWALLRGRAVLPPPPPLAPFATGANKVGGIRRPRIFVRGRVLSTLALENGGSRAEVMVQYARSTSASARPNSRHAFRRLVFDSTHLLQG
jgi:hypothetical protein